MNYKELIEKLKPEFEKIISFLDRDLKSIRTSRASSALVEDIEVDCFGKKFPLKQLAIISIPRPREILIQPWDASYIEGIVKALEMANLGTSPIIDGNFIKIILPPLTEEFRKNLLRMISEKKEVAKKRIRNLRREVWDEIQEKFREGKIREDDKFKAKDELQDLVEEYNQKIEEMVKKKEKEILE